MAQRDVVQKLWSLCNILRDDGITFHQYVNELTYLLFLKMAEERTLEKKIPIGYRWADLASKSGIDQFAFYRAQLVVLGTHGDDAIRAIFANPTSLLRHAETLNLIVESINSIDWYSAKREGLGDIYEGLLEKNAGEKKSGAGQYFTPRALIESIVAVMKPCAGDVVQDPAAGTGGFLVSAHQFLAQSEAKKKTATFLGMEHVQDVHRLALMNSILHGIPYKEGSLGIQYGDALGLEGARLAARGSTLVLTNPPFGTKRGGGLPARKDLPYPTSNKQLAFLQHIYISLSINGRAAVVLPDNVLFEGNIGREIRIDLMNKCNLHTILRLPTGIFYAPGVKTNVLFFARGASTVSATQQVWIYDLRTNMPQFGKRTQLQRSHFADFEKQFGTDPLGMSARNDSGLNGRFRCFTRKAIEDNDYSLDFNWLRDDGAQAPEDIDPISIAQDITQDLEAAFIELRGIMDMLSEGGSA